MPRVVFHDLLHLAFVCRPVPPEHVIGFGLRRRFGVRVVQELLDADQDLLDRDGGSPGLFFVEDGQANGARRIDVGMKEGRVEFAWLRQRR